MSKMYKKISVFLDTNILQTFIESHQRKSNVFLSNLGIPKEYYALGYSKNLLYLNIICSPPFPMAMGIQAS